MLDFLYFILTGAVVGWLAGKLIHGKGFGLFWNIIIGIGGAFVGNLLFSLTGLAYQNWIGKVIAGVIGAIVLLWLITAIRGRR
jgi:uncharacterized membrane protein YeaQ/YmgE (transglycosylase-associated protein family)